MCVCVGGGVIYTYTTTTVYDVAHSVRVSRSSVLRVLKTSSTPTYFVGMSADCPLLFVHGQFVLSAGWKTADEVCRSGRSGRAHVLSPYTSYFLPCVISLFF